MLETLPTSGSLTAQAVALAPAAATVRTTTATYDYASLSAHADRISAAMSQLSSGDMRIVSVGVDVPANRVKVGVGGASDSEQAALAASLGPDVEVVPGSILTPVSLPATCSSRTSCPLRAGLNISNLGYKQCTSNFFFKSSSGVTYLGTAGHCASSTWYQWYEGGNTNYYIGNNSGVSWYNGMNADAMLITHYSAAAKNLVYVSSTEMGRAMGSYMNNASQIFGTLACYSGATSGYRCGQVVGSDLTENNNGYTEYHMWEMDPAASDGDSGSPVFYSTREMGLVDAVSGAYTYYSTIDWIDSTFGTTPCVTSSC